MEKRYKKLGISAITIAIISALYIVGTFVAFNSGGFQVPEGMEGGEGLGFAILLIVMLPLLFLGMGLMVISGILNFALGCKFISASKGANPPKKLVTAVMVFNIILALVAGFVGYILVVIYQYVVAIFAFVMAIVIFVFAIVAKTQSNKQ